jgi:transcriptional regulator with PAS, ATPase and Fis domain
MDRGSKNGLIVDGARVTRRVAGDGSVVRVGGTVFVLREVGLDLPEPVAADVDFVGFSPSFRRAVEACSRVAPTTTTVLISGDTGTGKEVLARHVHDLSRRPGRFVAVNCAAVTPGLFESAMFGHRKGAFTGATGDFAGHARMAKGGTLFLDEIGELAPEVQAKLLRFLETGEVATVGDAAPVTVDVRVVAATNRDLLDAVEKGAFRRDLYARLAHWVVALPPLKERPEDVLLLAARALDPARLTADAAEALALHDWPFNVRELLAMTNEIRVRAPSMMEVAVAMLPEAVRSSVIPRRDEREDARAPSPADSVPGRAELESLLAECAGNVSEVARRLGKDRKQVYRWLGKHGLRATEG